jgi:hypothetical protein
MPLWSIFHQHILVFFYPRLKNIATFDSHLMTLHNDRKYL